MAELVWDKLAERFFETGVSNGVLYSPDNTGAYVSGVVWNGLTTVTAAPSGAEPNKQYADNINYVTLMSAEEFNGTIECFMFPDEFLKFNGVGKTASGMQVTGQSRPGFGFSWISQKGNAVDQNLGFVLNLAYGLMASPSESADATKNDSPELKALSFAVTGTPVSVAGFDPTSHIKIDSTDPDVDPDGLEALLDELWGRNAVVSPNLPLPDAVDALLAGTP